LSLRARFLAAVLLGVVLPLVIVGLWLTTTARRSGEAIVREQLDQALAELVTAVGQRWTSRQSLLLDIADSRAVQAALRDGAGLASQPEDALAESRVAWELAGAAESGELIDSHGTVVGLLPEDLGLDRPARPPGSLETLPYELPVRERLSGETWGTLRLQLRTDQLLPAGALALGIGGATVGVFDARTGTALVPMPVRPSHSGPGRFEWEGETWLAVRHEFRDPPLRFVVAGSVKPVTLPFEQAARRGTFALLLVVVGVFGLAAVFSRRLTRSMVDLVGVTRHVSSGDLTARAEETGPPEVRETARAFNAMSESLARTLEELSQKEAVAAVGQFAASLAHEIRNPLTAIRMDIQRAQKKLATEPDASRELLARSMSEIDRLNSSVEDVLRLARSGRVSAHRLDLIQPVQAAALAAEPHFQAAGARLNLDTGEAPIWVQGEEGSLEQLVLNLLLNASEACAHDGQATLRVDLKRGVAEVSVEDEGVGISEENLSRVFEPFFTTKERGTGLGLALARRIARAHGSDLTVSSSPGQGAAFRFELPLAPAGSTDRYGSGFGHDTQRNGNAGERSVS
jgi:signal transduction histidine kinase